MRGIPEDKAIEIGEQIDFCKYLECSVKEWLRDECQELQEPWITLEEFLKSGFVGLCWVEFPREPIIDAYFDGDFFRHSSTSGFIHNENYILRVQPIHKPEPPR